MKYNKSNPLRCFFAFEGYNSQGLALERLKRAYPEFDWVCVGRSEIDVNAIKAANALFPQYAHLNYGDIAKIDWGGQVADFDLFTYSFPCQSISIAGLHHGFSEGSGTRSSLLWECKRAIQAKHPKYLLLENVKMLLSKKFMSTFAQWCQWLEQQGYVNFYQILNAQDFDVPQHRERVFMVSIRDDGEHPKYNFPGKIPTNKCILDIMEDDWERLQAYVLPQEKITAQVVSDILDDEFAWAELTKLYHEEWQETNTSQP